MTHPIPETVSDLLARRYGLTLTAEFVPLSASRNRDEKHATINWRVTITRPHSRTSLTTDYQQGTGHLPPEYRDVKRVGSVGSIARVEAERVACERGRSGSLPPVVPPLLSDVLHCLVLDGGASNVTFADWCHDYGYDEDSRRAEELYRSCAKIGSKLAAMFTLSELLLLEETFRDY